MADRPVIAKAPKVQLRKISRLRPDPDNVRTHSEEQIDLIMASIRRFGWTMPMLVDDVIRAGNGRYAAAELLYRGGETIYMAPGKERGGHALPPETVPIIDCTGWTPEEKKAYALADNQLALQAGWDEERLGVQLQGLLDADFEIELIGFDSTELDRLLGDQQGEADPEEVPEVPAIITTRPSDIWLLGDHRLVCGSCTEAEMVAAVLGADKPNLMVTDPPYGVNYDPEWRERELDTWKAPRATGRVQNDDRADWTDAWALFPGNVAYVWHGGLHCGEVERSLEAVGFVMRAQIIWTKQHFVISRGDYHWQHEPCWYAVRKGKPGRYYGDRKQSTVWDIQNASAMGGDTSEGATGHGTQKPIECMKRPIEHNSKRGEAIYEPFCGSGTTVIAAELTGRRCLAVELDPAYCDVAVLRWERFTGRKATLASDGRTFADVALERASGEPATAGAGEQVAAPAL